MWNIKDIELEKYQMELYVMVFRNVYVGFFILMKKNFKFRIVLVILKVFVLIYQILY